MELKKYNNTSVIIPYFCGLGAHSPDHTKQALEKRVEWFRECIKSLLPFGDNFFIGTCIEEDAQKVQEVISEFDIKVNCVFFKGIQPHYLPYNLVRFTQSKLDDNKAPYVYYTEMDQVFYAEDFNYLCDLIDNDSNAYIVPQRFEQIPRHKVETRKKRFNVANDRFVEFKGVFADNNPYVVANEPWITVSYDDNFYVNKKGNIKILDDSSYGGAYGAAYFVSKKLFKSIYFNAVEFQPTEQTAGHDLLRHDKSICLKSKDLFYFHVDHLSGYEFNKNL